MIDRWETCYKRSLWQNIQLTLDMSNTCCLERVPLFLQLVFAFSISTIFLGPLEVGDVQEILANNFNMKLECNNNKLQELLWNFEFPSARGKCSKYWMIFSPKYELRRQRNLFEITSARDTENQLCILLQINFNQFELWWSFSFGRFSD